MERERVAALPVRGFEGEGVPGVTNRVVRDFEGEGVDATRLTDAAVDAEGVEGETTVVTVVVTVVVVRTTVGVEGWLFLSASHALTSLWDR